MVYEIELISEHKVLDDEAAQKVMKKFGVTPDKFPKILKTDPQISKFNPKEGQLVAIHRKDLTNSCTYYRVVVEPD